jgi:hypothetical protein
MKKILFFVVLLAVLPLLADPTYYPLTTIGEACVVENNAACTTGLQYLQNILDDTNRGEFFLTRLYHNSASLSSMSVEDRFAHHQATQVPTVVFNGFLSFVGPTPEATYANMVDALKYPTAPLKMMISNFDTSTGAASVTLSVLDPELVTADYQIVWFLVEDNVGNVSEVTRNIAYQDIVLPPAGQQMTYNNAFTIDAGWVADNLWLAASVEKNGTHILQSASTLPLPDYSLRCAFPWHPITDLVGDPSSSLNSQPLWFFNTGLADNLEMQLVVDDAPADWYFNYCDEDGNCYPGSMPLPITLAAGESKAFHLNLWIGSTGIAHFHYLITSPHLGSFTVPFVCRSSDYVSNGEQVLTPALNLGANHPNPFRGATAFSVSSDKASQSASVEIYDLRGRKVDETPLQNLSQGENLIAWQPSAKLPAGVYFYRLKGDRGSLRKLLYLK